MRRVSIGIGILHPFAVRQGDGGNILARVIVGGRAALVVYQRNAIKICDVSVPCC